MDPITDFYYANPGLWNAIIGILIFGGMARIAFWSNGNGLHVGGPLAAGLAMLLTVASLIWARENRRCIQELGPWAVLILVEAILLLAFNARRKSKQM